MKRACLGAGVALLVLSACGGPSARANAVSHARAACHSWDAFKNDTNSSARASHLASATADAARATLLDARWQVLHAALDDYPAQIDRSRSTVGGGASVQAALGSIRQDGDTIASQCRAARA